MAAGDLVMAGEDIMAATATEAMGTETATTTTIITTMVITGLQDIMQAAAIAVLTEGMHRAADTCKAAGEALQA
jgi:hypothetical protein